MGGCSSGPADKDQEVDLFLKKHHKLTGVHTDKNCYEISQ